ncbi:mRNA cap guanine-N7 methyltransferase [Acrasis kona]|uniref:mRNA cap guanine-N7 methyltransferase n=1 Tax=Acrasis kona TaxID=1008807 RepID=A0AAW2ZKX1_9EUKA
MNKTIILSIAVLFIVGFVSATTCGIYTCNLNDKCCNGECYNPNAYTCYLPSGKLCATGNAFCAPVGGEPYCYNPNSGDRCYGAESEAPITTQAPTATPAQTVGATPTPAPTSAQTQAPTPAATKQTTQSPVSSSSPSTSSSPSSTTSSPTSTTAAPTPRPSTTQAQTTASPSNESGDDRSTSGSAAVVGSIGAVGLGAAAVLAAL